MAETAQEERDQLKRELGKTNPDFRLLRLTLQGALNDADRLQRAEELLQDCQSRIPRNKAENTELHREIDQYFGRKP